MKRKKPYLRPEDWMFAVEEKESLPQKFQHYWISDENVSAALRHESFRELLKTACETGAVNPSKENNEIIQKPFIDLWSTQRNLLASMDSIDHGAYGEHAIVDIEVNPLPWDWDSDSTFKLYFQWDHGDPHLVAAFKEFLKKNRKKEPVRSIRLGKKVSSRRRLNQIAAYRLVNEFKSAKEALKQVKYELNLADMPDQPLYYKTPGSLWDAAKKNKKRINNNIESLKRDGDIERYFSSYIFWDF